MDSYCVNAVTLRVWPWMNDFCQMFETLTKIIDCGTIFNGGKSYKPYILSKPTSFAKLTIKTTFFAKLTLKNN